MDGPAGLLVAAVVSAAGLTLVCGLSMRRARGPMHRAVRHLVRLLAVVVALDFWCSALGLLGVQRDGWPASTWYGAAIGASVGALVSFLLGRTAGPARATAVRSRVAGTLEVLAVSWLCTITLLAGLDFQDGVKSWSRELPATSSPVIDLLRADLLAFAFGFAWAQILTNVLLKSLSEGSAEWSWSRRRRYLVMGAPVLLGLLVVPGQYPGATAGLLFRGLVLLAGWRYTREPPAGAWATFNGIRGERGGAPAEAIPRKARPDEVFPPPL